MSTSIRLLVSISIRLLVSISCHILRIMHGKNQACAVLIIMNKLVAVFFFPKGFKTCLDFFIGVLFWYYHYFSHQPDLPIWHCLSLRKFDRLLRSYSYRRMLLLTLNFYQLPVVKISKTVHIFFSQCYMYLRHNF